MNENEFLELAAGHALHALSDTDEQAFQQARTAHPEWEHHVLADLEVADALADAAPEIAPAPQIRGDLLARLGDLPQQTPGDMTASAAVPTVGDDAQDAAAEPSAAASGSPDAALGSPDAASDSPDAAPSRARGLSRRGMWALAASIALIAAIGIGALVVGPQLQPPASVLALEQIEAAPDAQSATTTTADGGEATLHWSDSLGQSVLVVDDLAMPPDGHTFELWFVRDGTPIAAGTFSPDDSGDALALMAGQKHEGDIIAVTVEVDGGSPDGQPTTDPIVAIET